MKLKIVLLFVFSVARAFSAGDTLSLSLTEALKLGREQSPSAKIARYAYDSRLAAYRSFSAEYLPQLSLSGDIPSFSRSISSIIQPDGTTIYTPQSQANSSLSLLLSQKIPLTGGEISLVSGLNRFDELEGQSTFYRANPLSVRFRQPLFQFNAMKWNAESEEFRLEIAKRQFTEAMEEVNIEISEKYFSAYIAGMNVRNAALNVAINDTLFNLSKGRFTVGKIAENEFLQSELASLNAQTELASAEFAFEQALQTLKIALGFPRSKVIGVLPPPDIQPVSVSTERALESANKRRSDRINFDFQKQSAEKSVAQAESANSFSATLSAQAGLNQSAAIMGEAYKNLRDQQQFSLAFDVPIVQWGRASQAVEAALAEKRRTELSVEIQSANFEREVIAQIERLKQLQKQVALSAKGDTIAQRRFDVAKDRYVIGKITVADLFLAQSEKDSSKRFYVQTLSDYWSAYYRLRRLTLFDFRNNVPIE